MDLKAMTDDGLFDLNCAVINHICEIRRYANQAEREGDKKRAAKCESRIEELRTVYNEVTHEEERRRPTGDEINDNE